MTANSHPARSPEFLSQLHDGELSLAERAHFESHRAHCAECRTSASEFEAALTLYRSSRPAPAAPDLAARILRKLQASGAPRRRLFGTTFGIDLRWAGAAAAAVLAAIVGSSIVATHEARERAARSPIPVLLKQAPRGAEGIPRAQAPASAPKPARLPSARSKDTLAKAPQDHERERGKDSRTSTVDALQTSADNSNRVATNSVAAAPAQEAAASASPPASAEEGTNEGKRERRAIVAAAPSSAASMKVSGAIRDEAQSQNQNQNPNPAQSPAQNQSQAQARAAEARPESPSAASTRRDTDRSGGEGGFAAEPQAPAPLHLIVTSVDGNSSVPALIPASAADLPVSLRGRQFFVLVDAAGRVREIRPRRATPQSNPAEGDGAPAKRNHDKYQKEKETESPVSVLRFQPGDAPRRLLIRVE